MRRTWITIVVLLFVVGGVGLLSGCAKKAQEEAMTTVDSTLALGEKPADVPEPGPTPGEQYNPPPQQSAPAPKSTAGTSPVPAAPSKAKAPGTVTVPEGTAISLTLSAPLTTKTAKAGEAFTATVAEDVTMNGRVVIPAGATVNGHVAVTERSGKASGRAYLQLAYDNLEFGGKSYDVTSVGDTIHGKGGSGKDAKMIGGGAAAGAILGGLLGRSAGGALKGAVVGGAAGTAASLLTRGPDVELKQGQVINLSLPRDLQVPKAKTGV